MINIVIKKHLGIPYEFDVSGHAGYAPFGKDIVCSAVSMLVITIANSMQINTKDKVNVRQDAKKARITIKIDSIKDGVASSEVITLSKTLYLGISETYKEFGNKYIKVKEEDFDD